jgi:hypothetical protein
MRMIVTVVETNTANVRRRSSMARTWPLPGASKTGLGYDSELIAARIFSAKSGETRLSSRAWGVAGMQI